MTRRPPASSISIRRSVECAGALSDKAAPEVTGPHSATTALAKPASDLLRSAAKALRQVTSRERDKPYRRAVAPARRGSDRLSKTIRAFSSSDQRRRRPVSTGGCGFGSLRFGPAIVCPFSLHPLLSNHILRQEMSRTRQFYTCAVLSERLQTLVAELREVEKLRSKLQRIGARAIGRRRRTKAGSRARAV
jgi:hypothetical protein